MIMDTWKYIVETKEHDAEKVGRPVANNDVDESEYLNKMGSEGWENYKTVLVARNTYKYYFKKKVK